MTSNNDSRKRRRVTVEEDSEAPSERGLVDGRDREEDQGLSLGPRDEGLSHDARDDDVSTRQEGEVTGDGRGASRLENSGLFGSFTEPDISRSYWDALDYDRRRRSGVAGHTRDGRQGDHGGQHASTSRTFTGGSTILEEGEVLSYFRRLAGGGTGINLDRDEGDADWADLVGPYRKWPIGTLTTQAVLGLASGRAPPGSLNYFVSLHMGYEMAMTQSPTNEVLSIHEPIKRPSSLDQHGNATHGLQRSQDSGSPRLQILCANLAAYWERGELGVLLQKFVIKRKHMAPLLIYTKAFCFIKLAIAYSNDFCEGEMPEALEGIWPFTKADAIRHKNQLRRFYEIGMKNMPAGELEGLSMADIRARYDTRGGIPPQYRHDTQWLSKPCPLRLPRHIGREAAVESLDVEAKPLGIKTLLIDDYKMLVEGEFARFKGAHHQQPGDSAKGVGRIVQMIKSDVAEGEIPISLALGEDALDRIRCKCTDTLELLEKWADESSNLSSEGIPF
ncbi:hypothetical protein INS49_014083 [Diaporthe citri]|uniref:uncharacterized protein n=1 Tax=Diaporthe citri TaxID=83186 RepID=UPI001C80B113|nr:uncharacterized protein INS49_014083 [Diaporthe citri]KAG6358199.1 hypothetical protein INS49_014083 [Diaporthe citri]